MPNTFGPPGVGYRLIDPRETRDHRQRFRRDEVPELRYANSYYSMTGRWPDVGWLLLDRDSYNRINKYATNLQLKIEDFVNPPLTITNLSIVQARCVTTGLSSDTNAVYLIRVTNNQGVLYNPWFQFPVNAQYNVRAPAYPQEYYSWSMNGAVAWTWSTMLGNLWALAPNQLGTFPGLPTTPLGTPENFIFCGEPLWEVIGRILDHLGMAVANEYPTFRIVVPGSADSSFTTLQTRYNQYLEDDMEYIDGGSARVPSQVVVFFHRRNSIYGTEETVRSDNYQWQRVPAYSVTVNAPAPFSSSAGVAYIWDDFTVRYDHDYLPIAADVTTANLIAVERATNFFSTIFRGTRGYMKQVYSGIIPFNTGSLVDGVRWYNTGCNGSYEGDNERYAGWHTEIIRGYVWDEAMFPTYSERMTGTP